MRRPIIGITSDVNDHRFQVGRAYAARIWEAGGLPHILPCLPAAADELLIRCDGLVLTGGDDPLTAEWGLPLHPKANPVHPDRQAFELAALRFLDERPQTPVLGVCLGMQYMGLHAGGRLNQHLPDTLPTASDHWDRRLHAVEGELTGIVQSHHRQALQEPGRLKVVATAADGVIEAVRAPGRRFYLGVQWHPERTDDAALGAGLFRQLVDAARPGRAD